MLTFDEFGSLTPDQPIESDLKEVESVLVFNERRRELFTTLLDFLNEMPTLGFEKFELWIDGSFATLKANPGDIDIVAFLDFGKHEVHEKQLKLIVKKFLPKLDIHYVISYPENHRLAVRTQFDRIEYLHLFLRDREKRRKGLIQINFHAHGITG